MNVMKTFVLICGFLILFLAEILRVYMIMPFPGSQESETIQMAYFIHQNVIYLRLLGAAMVAYPLILFFRQGKTVIRLVLAVVLVLYGVVLYLFNYRYTADHIFLQLTNSQFLDPENSRVLPGQVVVGVFLGGEAKAYPLPVIGYHHQVRDTLAGQPIMVTYCTVCRTGRVYLPVVNGKPDVFRLVGMDHYNAMFEDSRTGSWWRQVNGEAIVGELKGTVLPEVGSEQMSLSAWIDLHPETKILQPDTTFADRYEKLKDYGKGKKEGRLERKDSLSWKDKSWIVGVRVEKESRAYDWNDLQRLKVIDDELNGLPLVLTAGPDSLSFYSYSRIVEGDTLAFSLNGNGSNLVDAKTGSVWDWNGRCVEGMLKGKSLIRVQSYQEYWHSWKTFHPQTTRYTPL